MPIQKDKEAIKTILSRVGPSLTLETMQEALEDMAYESTTWSKISKSRAIVYAKLIRIALDLE
jgi:hypothetical protein